MEEDSDHSQGIIIPENDIRSIEKSILAQIEKFEKKSSDKIFFETSNVCDEVKNQILNYEDEPLLSKTHNNYRRIVIASDLFIGICSIYEHVVDYELTKIIGDIIQREKYEKLSKTITHSLKLQLKRQKYFTKEAQSKLVKNLEDTAKRTLDAREENVGEDVRIFEEAFFKNGEQATRPAEDKEQEPRALEHIEQQSRPKEVTELVEKPTETETLSRFEKELSFASHKPIHTPETTKLHETFIELRAEPVGDTSHLQYSISNITRPDITQPDILAGVSVEDIRPQLEIDDDINQILKVLKDQNAVGEIEQPGHAEIADKIIKPIKDASVEELPAGKQIDIDLSEESEEWILPRLELVKSTTIKQRHLKIDKITVIHGYATKALQLNRNINVQRVQVFEGPPKILQAMSVNHLMTTPGYKKSIFRDERSFKLSKLYDRHLEIEKKPVETVVFQTRKVEKQKEIISRAKTNVDIIEELGVPVGMRSQIDKGDVLAEAVPPPEKILEDIEISAIEPHHRDSLIGIPVSRIINGIVESPEAQMERINAVPALPVSRVQELQGKSLESQTSSPWFISTKENPPSEKYREFNYVYNKLQKYWLLFENQEMEKCITLREFFSFEEDGSVPNFLTVLRIVDKMSIQRKLVLEFKDRDVFIRPFETPYVSEKQMSLKGKEPIL